MKLNMQIFHEFFYSDGHGERRGKANVSYTGRHFFSYSTEIGYLYNKTGRSVLFVSDYGFSTTTRGHLSALIAAAPVDFIRVPFDWNDNFSYREAEFPAEMAGRFAERLAQFRPEQFTRAENRREFSDISKRYTQFMGATGQKIPAKTRALIDKLKKLAADTEENRQARRAQSAKLAEQTRRRNEEKRRREQEERERREREERAERERREQILAAAGANTIIARAIIAFARGTTSEDIRRAATNTLQEQYPECAFIWPGVKNPDTVETSKGIHVSKTTARRLLALWNAGRARVGMHCGPYVVRNIDPEFVQIGCHKIPVDNLRELAAALN